MHPDAELIALTAQHIVNVRAYNGALRAGASLHFSEKDGLREAYEHTRDAISEARPKTIEGMVAIARAAMAEAGPGAQHSDDRLFHSMEERWSWNLVCDLLRLHGETGSAAA